MKLQPIIVEVVVVVDETERLTDEDDDDSDLLDCSLLSIPLPVLVISACMFAGGGMEGVLEFSATVSPVLVSAVVKAEVMLARAMALLYPLVARHV